ncbi:unnamed protein product [Vitrella brassicaformis CCMP3155]|uniref:HTH CENPB-type domain-containing protein n=1 Tax=Vitrella brassicaformis (strain CCMP3155) TaxID=1169540 RepID=A0A0G4EIE6_VITBC|nr:unnamed protein product [Vitrella brassicaformis CCMP3155]|eukprot:CEL95756.1 unnamed protein product [Vitrella brassicaformis CCMP3155]
MRKRRRTQDDVSGKRTHLGHFQTCVETGQCCSSHKPAAALPASPHSSRVHPSYFPSQQRTAASKQAAELTIGEREALLADFERRKAAGEALTQQAFALEKGIIPLYIPLTQFKNWCHRSSVKREPQHEAADKSKKRYRQSPFQPIEVEVRQWMAGHEDQRKIPIKAIRAKAIEIAVRLGISGFSASDTWIRGVNDRYMQDQGQASSAAAAAASAPVALPSPPVHPTHPLPSSLPNEGAAFGHIADAFIGWGTSDESTERERPVIPSSHRSGASPATRRASSQPPPHQPAAEADGTPASSRGRSKEYTIAERTALVDEFSLRQAGGEKISQRAFAREKGISFDQFKHWVLQIKKLREEGQDPSDISKRRHRAVKWPQIEQEMAEWLGSRSDPSGIAKRELRDKAKEIAARLQATDFKCSDSWLDGFRKRYQQAPSKRQSASVAPLETTAAKEQPLALPFSSHGLASDLTSSGAAQPAGTDFAPLQSYFSSPNPWEPNDPPAVTATPSLHVPLTSCRPPAFSAPIPTEEASVSAAALVAGSADGADCENPHRIGDLASSGEILSGQVYTTVRMGDSFIGPITDLSRQTTTCPPNDEVDSKLEQPSEGQTTMSMVPSESRLTNQRPPTKVQRTNARSHRHATPSVVSFRSSGISGRDLQTNLGEADADIGSVSDADSVSVSSVGAAPDVAALSTCSTTDDGDMPTQRRVIAGSSLRAPECAALHSLFVPSIFEEITFTLLYRASHDGATFGDLLRCVGDTKSLVFAVRKGGCLFGAYISDGVKLPDGPTAVNSYSCDAWQFSLADHFNTPTKIDFPRYRKRVEIAARECTVDGAVAIGDGQGLKAQLCFGYGRRDGAFGADMRSCYQNICRDFLPEGYQGARGDGHAFFGGGAQFMADELEVIRVDGLFLLSPQGIEGSSLGVIECAALYCFLGITTQGKARLLYSASRDCSSYAELIRCVGDATRLVFVIRKGAFVFGAYTSGGLHLPDDPAAVNSYNCDVWHFSLAGHFKTPTKIDMPDRQLVRVAGREAGAMLLIGEQLFLGYGGSHRDSGADLRSCYQLIFSSLLPAGYQGARDGSGNAVFGGSGHFIADDLEVLTAGERDLPKPSRLS